ncbi:MAG: hypothetical protein IKD83_02795 [Firmicutes bacterium]|nr:hypothetical protein [Bacillota bacterium]
MTEKEKKLAELVEKLVESMPYASLYRNLSKYAVKTTSEYGFVDDAIEFIKNNEDLKISDLEIYIMKHGTEITGKEKKLLRLVRAIPDSYDNLEMAAFHMAEKYNALDEIILFIEEHPTLTSSDLVLFMSEIGSNIPEPFERIKYSFEQ